MTAPPAPSLRPASAPTHPHVPRTVPAAPAVAHLSVVREPVAPPRRVARLVVLGDSTAVGIGDPVDGGWRGFPVLLRDALDPTHLDPSDPDDGPPTTLTNLARSGARMGGVRHDQLPAALEARPDVAVVSAGMNDTLRSDFDPAAIEADCAATVEALRAVGATVVVMRYHDHTKVFRLPAPLRRALHARIAALNAAIDTAAARAGAVVLDLDALPGGYDPAAWAVDRLHPSELGHRLLAASLTELIAAAGFAVPTAVALTCSGGRRVTAAHRVAWLVVKGVPWLVRRGGDLGPVIVIGLADGLRRGHSRP